MELGTCLRSRSEGARLCHRGNIPSALSSSPAPVNARSSFDTFVLRTHLAQAAQRSPRNRRYDALTVYVVLPAVSIGLTSLAHLLNDLLTTIILAGLTTTSFWQLEPFLDLTAPTIFNTTQRVTHRNRPRLTMTHSLEDSATAPTVAMEPSSPLLRGRRTLRLSRWRTVE